MLLFKKAFFAGLTSGAITLTFRRWQKPHVRVGGRYRCHPIGVLEVDRVDRVRAAAISADDAQRAGFATLPELRAYLEELGPLADDDELWRVELHYGGDGDRVEIALADQLTEDDVQAIAKKLEKLDGRKPWTDKTLAIIGKHPRVAASKLAAKLGRETQPFKIDVRKLKKLGLTQSFEVGYEISPRGKAYLTARAKSAPRRAARRAR
ncbi:MAG TPA: ASCH domain-containing protein [Kofleriaceae bacterium]|nr:ASCH domain-containing protein [Kofleriaceae bacterium]